MTEFINRRFLMDRDKVDVHENAAKKTTKKKTRLISRHLVQTSLVNNGYLRFHRQRPKITIFVKSRPVHANFFNVIIMGNSARIANQNTDFRNIDRGRCRYIIKSEFTFKSDSAEVKKKNKTPDCANSTI